MALMPTLNSILFFLSFVLPAFLAQINPFPATVQTQTLHPAPPSSSQPATIPAFPEQTYDSSCPLELPEQLFHSVNSACGTTASDRTSFSAELHRSRCCPVLGAWLYSAYSRTALRVADGKSPQTTSYDMPVLPDDSESCVESLEKALANRGVLLRRPNETCDVVYCYCGIRLHPFSCPESFRVSTVGELEGGTAVKKLESACSGGGGLAVCNKCLDSLYLLNGEKAGTSNRTSKMHNRDCELMGLTWLLNKNRTAYMHSVTGVLRAIMMNGNESSDPRVCNLNSDGIPLAVDSAEINGGQSSSTIVWRYMRHQILLLVLLFLIYF